MNEIINWIAIHNTLMIRIGFTAILVLLIVYIFRFFFVPKVNVVHESIEPKQAKETSEKNNSTESPSDDEAEASLALTESNELKQYEKEIERLNKELALIRNQLKESDSPVAESASTEAPVAAVDVEKVNILNQKIENLESRLAEYEIIAEDISEIGQLRKENAELKQKMTDDSGSQNPQVAQETQETEASASAPEEPTAEAKSSDENLMNEEAMAAIIDEVNAGSVETETPVENEVADIKLTSEKEVTQSERELIDQFEEISNKKGS